MLSKEAATGFVNKALRRTPSTDQVDDKKAEVAMGGSTRKLTRQLSREEEDAIFERQEGGTLDDVEEEQQSKPAAVNDKTASQRVREWTDSDNFLWGSSSNQ